jgi:hypothetical protein
MNLKDAMSEAILRAILARPDRVPEPLLEAARALDNARAEWTRARADWATVVWNDWWKIEDTLAKEESNYERAIRVHASELPAMLGE